MLVRLQEKRCVQCRRQRRSLAPGRDITTPEIRDDRNPGRLDQARGIGQLNGVADVGSMANRLAMDTNRGNIGCRHSSGSDHLANGERATIHQRVGG